MSTDNQVKYKLADAWINRFCAKGCSVICEQEFYGYINNRSKKKVLR